jgi:hypothetical protein
MKYRIGDILAIGAVWFLTATSAISQQLTITTSPSPPKANQPFQLVVTGVIEPPLGRASISVSGGTVAVVFSSACDYLCVPIGLATILETGPPLAPGPYLLTVDMGSTAGAHSGQISFTVAPATSVSYSGLWWYPQEPGWGVTIEHQADTIFAAWFTYASDGSGMWLVMSNGVKTADATYSGTLFRTTGPSFEHGVHYAPWNSSDVKTTAVGTARLKFADANNGTFGYTLYGITQEKPITRQLFAIPAP